MHQINTAEKKTNKRKWITSWGLFKLIIKPLNS